MSRAQELAGHLRSEFLLAETVPDCDLEAVCAAMRLDVAFGESLPADLPELYVNGRLALRRGLPDAEERWLIAHGLGHHLMHKGSRFRVDRATLAKKEREAEEFAGYLFLARTWALHPAWELAEMHTLPQARVERWLGIRDGRLAVSADWRP